MTDDPGTVDVRGVVADIEATVRRRRAAGEYPDDLLASLHAEFTVTASADPPEAYAVIRSSRPLYSARPGIGGLIVFGKRVMRRLMSWYVHPITEDQTHFNLALLRELRSLEQRVAQLEARENPDDATSTSG